MMRVATHSGDYAKAHALLKKEGFERQKLGFPTILSMQDDEVVGVVATKIQDGMVVAGPLAVDTSVKRTVTAVKLMMAYENALRNIGLTSYILPTEAGGIIDKVIKRYYPNLHPYAVQGEYKFYIRYLDGSQDQEELDA